MGRPVPVTGERTHPRRARADAAARSMIVSQLRSCHHWARTRWAACPTWGRSGVRQGPPRAIAAPLVSSGPAAAILPASYDIPGRELLCWARRLLGTHPAPTTPRWLSAGRAERYAVVVRFDVLIPGHPVDRRRFKAGKITDKGGRRPSRVTRSALVGDLVRLHTGAPGGWRPLATRALGVDRCGSRPVRRDREDK
jgi:hypothetical protein